jgi:hypothetical protein
MDWAGWALGVAAAGVVAAALGRLRHRDAAEPLQELGNRQHVTKSAHLHPAGRKLDLHQTHAQL